jgi:hypothetical protein
MREGVLRDVVGIVAGYLGSNVMIPGGTRSAVLRSRVSRGQTLYRADTRPEQREVRASCPDVNSVILWLGMHRGQ